MVILKTTTNNTVKNKCALVALRTICKQVLTLIHKCLARKQAGRAECTGWVFMEFIKCKMNRFVQCMSASLIKHIFPISAHSFYLCREDTQVNTHGIQYRANGLPAQRRGHFLHHSRHPLPTWACELILIHLIHYLYVMFSLKALWNKRLLLILCKFKYWNYLNTIQIYFIDQSFKKENK